MSDFDDWLEWRDYYERRHNQQRSSERKRERAAAMNLAKLQKLLRRGASETEPANGARDDE